MRNQLLFKALALLTCLSCALGASAYNFVSNGIYYNTTGTNTVEVTYKDTNYNCYAGNMTVPSTVTYNGKTYTVKTIGASAFRGSTGLTSVIIPNTVTTIGNDAFNGCNVMEKITIGSGVTSIGSQAFTGCLNLSPVTCLATTPPTIQSNTFSSWGYYATLRVPKGRKSAYQTANYWKNFQTIEELPYDFVSGGIYYSITGTNTVEVTHDGSNNTYRGSVSIPSTVANGGTTYLVTAIGEKAFYYCTALTSVDIPISVTIIRDVAFAYCRSLPSVTIPNSVTTICQQAFRECNALTSVTIPNSVTTIDNNAFSTCQNLTEVTIGCGVTSIGEFAFYYNDALLTVTCKAMTPPTIQSTSFHDVAVSDGTLYVPSGRKSAYQAANYWKNFTTINELHYDFEKDGIYYNITGSNTVEVTYKDTGFHSYSGSVTIPSTVSYGGKTYQVTAIGDWAFAYCWDLTSVTIGNKVASIGDEAFENCTGLTSVTIPNSVLTIGSRAFCNSWRITELTIGNSVISIGSSAFGSCSALTNVTIPNSVTSIGDEAFSYCYDLVSVVIGSSVTFIGKQVFQDIHLQNITCLAVIPPIIQSITFRDYHYSTATLYVPAGCKNAYQTANYWKNFTHILSIGSPGDLNGDGVLDVSDVTALISMVLGNIPANPALGDLNGDGVVDVADVTALIALVLNN